MKIHIIQKNKHKHIRRHGYIYDALGRHIEKHRLDRDGKPCNRTTFLWDGMQMIQESSADKLQSLYLYTNEGSYELLAQIDRTSNQEEHIYHFHTNPNGILIEWRTENPCTGDSILHLFIVNNRVKQFSACSKDKS